MDRSKTDKQKNNQDLDRVKFCDLYALDLPDNGICLIDPQAIEELLEIPPQQLSVNH